MSTDPRIVRLNEAQPSGLVRDGHAMTLVRLEDAHAAAQQLHVLEASVVMLTHDLKTVTATKDALIREMDELTARVAQARNLLN